MSVIADHFLEAEARRERLIKAKSLFFVAAALSFVLSVYLYFSGDKQHGIFVGLWVPSILSAGTLLTGGK
jgi:hypothetical protein